MICLIRLPRLARCSWGIALLCYTSVSFMASQRLWVPTRSTNQSVSSSSYAKYSDDCLCPLAHISKTHHRTLERLLPVAVAWSASGGVARHYVLPVLRLTSCLHTMGAMVRVMCILRRRTIARQPNILHRFRLNFTQRYRPASVHRQLCIGTKSASYDCRVSRDNCLDVCVTVLKVYSANGENTIETVDRLFNRTIGQRVQLSFIDTKLINLVYCSGQTSSTHRERERERERETSRQIYTVDDRHFRLTITCNKQHAAVDHI